MRSILLLLFTTLYINLQAQDMAIYQAHVEKGNELYQSKDYKQSAAAYKDAFDEIDGKARPNDRYNAACSYALAGNTEMALYHLVRLAETSSKYRNYEHITSDTDLNSLHDDPLWEVLIPSVKANKDEYEKDLDKPLAAMLDSVYTTDQQYRQQINEIEEKYGRDSEEMKAHWSLIQETDSINLIKVQKVLDERGWLGPKVVGGTGSSALFLVIQHSDLPIQEKYLPMMREAVKAGNASGSSLALLEDRVAMRQGKRQIYGSQIGRDQDSGDFYVFPIDDPANVNERRQSVGLGPIEDYVSRWDIQWDVEAHIALTKELDAKKE